MGGTARKKEVKKERIVLSEDGVTKEQMWVFYRASDWAGWPDPMAQTANTLKWLILLFISHVTRQNLKLYLPKFKPLRHYKAIF